MSGGKQVRPSSRPFVANPVSWKRHDLGYYVETTVETAQVLVVIYTPARSATWSFNGTPR